MIIHLKRPLIYGTATVRLNLRRRGYMLTNVETGEEVLVQDASDFEAKAGITHTIISRTANPKQVRQKFVTIDGVRYTADYSE